MGSGYSLMLVNETILLTVIRVNRDLKQLVLQRQRRPQLHFQLFVFFLSFFACVAHFLIRFSYIFPEGL